MTPTSLRRLARANPLPPEQVRTDPARTQAILEQILATPRDSAVRRRPRRSRRFAGIAAIAVLATAGGAFAATDPFGFWRSSTPGTAMYGVDAARHAKSPTIQRIGCLPAGGGAFRCGAHVRGVRYELMDRIQRPASFNRAKLVAALDHAGMSQAQRRRIASDLAAVPDSFLAGLSRAFGFGGTYSTDGMVPPRGVPMWLACGLVGGSIACRDLNGDEHTPVGSAIYMAIQDGPGWRRAPAGTQSDAATNARLLNTILGHPLTPAEIRTLIDLGGAVTTSGSTRVGPTRAPARPSPSGG
jgi:hypothetical protein